MDINIVGLIVTIVIAGVAWWINDVLNKVAILKTVVQVIIVVVALCLIWQDLGIHNQYIHIGR